MFHIVLFSGGLDSVTLAYHTLYTKCKAGDTLVLHTFDTHERISQVQHSNNIMDIVADLCMRGSEEGVEVHYIRGDCGVSEFSGDDSAFVPYRNTLFVFNALHTYYQREEVKIYLGVINNLVEGYGDCSPEFINSLNDLIKVQKEKAEVLAPFVHLTKYDVLLIANSFDVPVEKTWSCLAPSPTMDGYTPCKECVKCKEREELGIKI